MNYITKSSILKHEVTVIDRAELSGTASVTVQANPDDDNLTFTLDRIIYSESGFQFEASNSCENTTFDEKSIPTDALIDIYNYVVENEDKIG